MVRIKGEPIEEVDTDKLKEISSELDEMIADGTATEGDVVAWFEIQAELFGRDELQELPDREVKGDGEPRE